MINKPALQARPDEKAWTIYRDLWMKHGFGEGGSLDLKEIYCQDADGRHYGPLARPSDGPAWEVATKKMAAVPDLIEGFRTGGVRPHFGVPMYLDLTQHETNDFAALFPGVDREALLQAKSSGKDALTSGIESPAFLTSIALPQVQTIRSAASLLVVDTRLALEHSDVERATRNVADSIDSTNHRGVRGSNRVGVRVRVGVGVPLH
ncbi:MAG: hypothetical protein Q8M16_09370 [Pirellulaceae bacterium]|nr:hypothetical protein [Pirellulaceae bacterium]